jgi:hypothetical protein
MPIKLGGRRGAGVVVVDQTILLAGGTEPTEARLTHTLLRKLIPSMSIHLQLVNGIN